MTADTATNVPEESPLVFRITTSQHGVDSQHDPV